MTADRIRQKFISFFVKKKHRAVASSSLWPKDDPSVLLTTAGMQQFKPYFLGARDPQKDFGSRRLVSVQRCFRTSDIELVGDAWHCTFFEMLGNFSFGDYFEKGAIDLAWEFLTKVLGLDKKRLWVTYFKGDDEIAADEETIQLWQRYVPKGRVAGFGRQENWWGPPGAAGPCGPCSEIHYDFTGQPCAKGSRCQPNCECGRFMEVWNLVFMEYHLDEKKKLKELPTKNIDTGLGLERLALILQRKKSIFETDLFAGIIQAVTRDKNFGRTNEFEDTVRSRIVADHLKGVVFLLDDGIAFSNKEQGYVLRRLFRRALDQYLHQNITLLPTVEAIIKTYEEQYHYLRIKKDELLRHLQGELVTYQKLLQLDIQDIVEKMSHLKEPSESPVRPGPSSRRLSAAEAATIYTTYGVSADRLRRAGFTFDEKEFKNEIEKHQALSRAGAKAKFGGHGLDSAEWTPAEREKMTKLHTATHLLHQALRQILGAHVRQQGSDINPERLRFDFDHPQKLTDGEKKEIEDLVSRKISEDVPVKREEMSYATAVAAGALAFFKEKYPEHVSVYSIGDFSKEICGGPHVSRTGQLGTFRIISEKSSSAGIRRIKAVVQ